MTIVDDYKNRTVSAAITAAQALDNTEENGSNSERDIAKDANHPTLLSRTSAGGISEHGHTLEKIRPMTKHSGTSVAIFFSGLFQTIIAVGTLGTSVTFSYVLTNNIPGPTSSFTDPNVQTFLAISWLLFLLSLAFACLGSTLLTFFRAHWEKDWDGEHGRKSQAEVQMYAVLMSGLLGALIVAAFIFLCLVVRSFTPVVGWTALGFTCWFGLIILCSVLWQVPWPWRHQVLRS